MAGKHELADETDAPATLPLPPIPDPPVIDWDVLTQADARERALRTLVYGLLLSVVWGAVSISGSLAGINWFTHDGLQSALALLGAAVGNAVLSYLGRLKWSPSAPIAPK